MKHFFLAFVETHCNNNYDHNICNAITDGRTLACIAGSVRLEIWRRSSRRRSETSTRAIHGASRAYCAQLIIWSHKITSQIRRLHFRLSYEKLGKSCSSDERRKAVQRC